MSSLRLSIIIPVLNSHEIVRRQILHYEWFLPHDAELLIVDDGSEPPIEDESYTARIIYTHDKRQWTQPIARNIGAQNAIGEFLIFTDIDHIIPEETIRFAEDFKYGYGRFKREVAVLDKDGHITQDRDELAKYGFPKERGLRVGCHTLSMIVRADVFRDTGGFRENIGHYPTHDDGDMKRKLKHLERVGVVKCPDDERPVIYMFPNGRFCGDKDCNPFGLFHELKR
jgi:glycosyltransferase involved in cell wall biosynthesis